MIIDVESFLDCTCCLSTIKINCEQVRRWKLKQVSWQVIAHMWGNEGILCCYQYGSTLWHLELRVEVAWDSYVSLLWNDSSSITVGFARNTTSWVPSLWRSTDEACTTISRAFWSALAGSIVSKFDDEAQANVLTSHCTHVREWGHFVLLSIWLNALASGITSWGCMGFIPEHALKRQQLA